MNNIIRRKNEKDKLINQIIIIEADMFKRVSNVGDRAECQDDDETFYIMRYSQHNAFDEEMLKSYLTDLVEAVRAGRNIISEKYGYMMEYTDREYYDGNLKGKLAHVTEEQMGLIRDIADKMMSFHRGFSEKYPLLSGKGRGVQVVDGWASTEVYLLGELKTLSQRTLVKYLDTLNRYVKADDNLVEKIQSTMVDFYGYAGLEDAESKLG